MSQSNELGMKIMPIGDGLLLALIGMLVVFAVLILLYFIIQIQGRVVSSAAQSREAKKAASTPAAVAAVTAVTPVIDPNAGKVPAAGSLGEVDLHNVDDATAALLMAVVADDLKTPLNELRFISIQEVKK